MLCPQILQVEPDHPADVHVAGVLDATMLCPPRAPVAPQREQRLGVVQEPPTKAWPNAAVVDTILDEPHLEQDFTVEPPEVQVALVVLVVQL